MVFQGGKKHGTEISKLSPKNWWDKNPSKTEWYCWLLMEEILHQLICSLSHCLQGLMHSKWLAGFLPSMRKKEDETLERNNNWKNSRGPPEIWDAVDGRNPAITTWNVSKPCKQWDFNYQPQLVSQILDHQQYGWNLEGRLSVFFVQCQLRMW